MLISGKISEDTYDKLWEEGNEKILSIRIKIQEMEFDARQYLDDLQVALVLMAKLPILFNRLDVKQKTCLLQIVAKRIIISCEGEIISCELHSPFAYLSTLATSLNRGSEEGCGSEHVPLGHRRVTNW